MAYILSYAREAGGAEVVAPVIKILNKKYEILLLAKDYACERFKHHELKVIEIKSFEDILDVIKKKGMPGVILTSATSLPWNDMNEKYLWEWGRKNKVPSVAIVDQWQNYALRFSGEKEEERLRYLPDRICIMDEYSKNEAVKEGIPKDRVIVTGQPSFDRLASCRINFKDKEKIRNLLGVSKDEILVTFVSEAIHRDFKDSLGYNEADTLNCIISSLLNLLQEGHRFALVVKLHPQNRIEDFEQINFEKFKMLKIRIISKEVHPLDLIMSSDIVVGMSSILLVESILLKKPTISLQLNAKKDDNLVATKVGAIPLITNEKKFGEVLESLIKDKRYVKKYLRTQEKMKADGHAAERVAGIVQNLIVLD